MSEHDHPQRPKNVEDDDPDALTAAFVGLAGFVLLFVAVVALQGLFERSARREFERKVVRETPEELQVLRAGQLDLLSRYRFVDAKAGIVAMPIERAMEIVARERKTAPSKP